MLLARASMLVYTFLCFIAHDPPPELHPTEVNKNLSPELHCRTFWTPGSATTFSKTMKFLLLTLTVFLILFQMLPGNQNKKMKKRELRWGTACERCTSFLSIQTRFSGLPEICLTLSGYSPRTDLRPHIGKVFLVRIPRAI